MPSETPWPPAPYDATPFNEYWVIVAHTDQPDPRVKTAIGFAMQKDVAVLWSAAPDLYEALKQASFELQRRYANLSGYTRLDLIKQILGALAKARGEQSNAK